MSHGDNTQLTNITNYDANKRMVFSEPIEGSVPDSKPKIEFKRINISTRNEDGSYGELVFPTERLFSFGVSENVSQETGKITGYTFPLCLYSRESPTEAEKQWVEGFNNIVDKCIDWLIDHKEEIEADDLTRSELTKVKGGLNPLYIKRERVKNSAGKMELRPVDGQGPALYTKLIFSKKNDKFVTQFYDTNDQPLNALDLMGKYCYTRAAVKIESIFISGTGKISLQVKLYEAVVEPSKTGMKRLLRPEGNSKVLSSQNNSNAATIMGGDDDDEVVLDDGTGSLVGSDDEAPVAAPVKRTVRKTKKVIKK